MRATLLPNQGVHLTPLARFLGWARFTRHTAPACWRIDNPQPSDVLFSTSFLARQGSAARSVPSTCLCPTSSTLHTPASGAADRYTIGDLWVHLRSARFVGGGGDGFQPSLSSSMIGYNAAIIGNHRVAKLLPMS